VIPGDTPLALILLEAKAKRLIVKNDQLVGKILRKSQGSFLWKLGPERVVKLIWRGGQSSSRRCASKYGTLILNDAGIDATGHAWEDSHQCDSAVFKSQPQIH